MECISKLTMCGRHMKENAHKFIPRCYKALQIKHTFKKGCDIIHMMSKPSGKLTAFQFSSFKVFLNQGIAKVSQSLCSIWLPILNWQGGLKQVLFLTQDIVQTLSAAPVCIVEHWKVPDAPVLKR